jgi:uncharacterized OsmC-like protein
MFEMILNDSPTIEVKSRKYQYLYSTDGSLANPLEATYAALSGCAAVYVKKAGLKLKKSVEGIQIKCHSVIQPESPLLPLKWVTQIVFTPEWSESDQQLAVDYVTHCAVKELIQKGHQIQFEVSSLTT